MVIDEQVLDGFEVILNNLNNIWKKCLDDFCLCDLDNDKCISISTGLRRQKGEFLPLSINTIKTWFSRSLVHPLWEFIQSFNGFYASASIEKFTKPIQKNFLYVHNAFKAFLSTSLSHFDGLHPIKIGEAINKIIDYTYTSKKGLSLLEDVYLKRMDRFRAVEIKNPDVYKNERLFFLNLFTEIRNSYQRTYDKGVGNAFIAQISARLGLS